MLTRRTVKVVVATHGHCFDGLASAAVFTRLLRSVERPTEFVYRACGYGIGQAHPSPKMLTGDQNAILDFRFAPEAAVTWYFDHHRTAFADAEARAGGAHGNKGEEIALAALEMIDLEKQL